MCSDKKDSYQRLRVLRSVKAGISVTDILSRTVSELSQNIVPILDTLRFWATLWGLGTTYRVHLELIGKRIVDLLLVLIELFSIGVTAEALRAKID